MVLVMQANVTITNEFIVTVVLKTVNTQGGYIECPTRVTGNFLQGFKMDIIQVFLTSLSYRGV